MTARRLVYVVVPHPDDELGAWSLLADRPDQYPVFVLCTHGEQTVYADGRGLQVELGERVPQPQPWGVRGSATLRAQRLDSWAAFLDGVSALDSHLDADLVDHGELRAGRSSLRLQVGERSARAVFDGGDGRLTADVVTAALQRTRELRTTHLPVQEEGCVIGAAYWNDRPGSVRYVHPDHRAVHEALWHTDQGVPGPQWCRTASVDPDAVRIERILPTTYVDLMAIEPGGWRSGLFQAVYGWLAPPSGWPAGETDARTVWSREQVFWRRFG